MSRRRLLICRGPCSARWLRPAASPFGSIPHPGAKQAAPAHLPRAVLSSMAPACGLAIRVDPLTPAPSRRRLLICRGPCSARWLRLAASPFGSIPTPGAKQAAPAHWPHGPSSRPMAGLRPRRRVETSPGAKQAAPAHWPTSRVGPMAPTCGLAIGESTPAPAPEAGAWSFAEAVTQPDGPGLRPRHSGRSLTPARSRPRLHIAEGRASPMAPACGLAIRVDPDPGAKQAAPAHLPRAVLSSMRSGLRPRHRVDPLTPARSRRRLLIAEGRAQLDGSGLRPRHSGRSLTPARSRRRLLIGRRAVLSPMAPGRGLAIRVDPHPRRHVASDFGDWRSPPCSPSRKRPNVTLPNGLRRRRCEFAR